MVWVGSGVLPHNHLIERTDTQCIALKDINECICWYHNSYLIEPEQSAAGEELSEFLPSQKEL